MNSNAISKKCRKIKLVITDVDGVLTDGGMYYSEKGEELKKFNTKDGICDFLRNNGIKTVFLTGENSKFAKIRGKKVKADQVILNVKSKEKKLPSICKKFNLIPIQIAYIGDDVNDLEIMKKIGFSASPSNAIDSVKKQVDYVCKLKGGDGVFREFAELIIKYKNN